MADQKKYDANLSRLMAEIFIKEPSSLELLLMLADEGPKTIGQISNYFLQYGPNNTSIRDILDKLEGFNLIDIKDDLVDITILGKTIVVNLRKIEKKNNETIKCYLFIILIESLKFAVVGISILFSVGLISGYILFSIMKLEIKDVEPVAVIFIGFLIAILIIIIDEKKVHSFRKIIDTQNKILRKIFKYSK